MRSIRLYAIEISLIAALIAAIGFFGYLGYGLVGSSTNNPTFSGEQALLYVARQLEFGPRTTGSQSSIAMTDWLIEELGKAGWAVYIQPFSLRESDLDARNIIAVRGEGPTAMLATTYDSRLFADQDRSEERQAQPVPGANDGASGAAVLLELARSIDVVDSGREICLVFFDAGNNGQLAGWEADLGQRYFIEQLSALPRCGNPQVAVTINGIGDLEQRIFRPENGDPALINALWTMAAQLEYNRWIVDRAPDPSVDSPNLFQTAGIPSAAIVDANYVHRHTASDTLDKVSAESLHRVGRLLELWIEAGAPF